MGTDIHTACEVRKLGFWYNSGPVFAATRDWDSRVIFEPIEAADITDAALLRGLHGELSVATKARRAGVADVRALLNVEQRAEVDEALKLLNVAHEQASERYESHRESDEPWDYYGVVKPDVDAIWQAFRDSFSFTEGTRKAIVDSIVSANAPWKDADEYDSDLYEKYGRGAVRIKLRRLVDEPPFKTAHPYEDRNYMLFEVLAGVRNGYGFAGVPTHRPLTPISEPRGLPVDITPESMALLSGDHTPTWVSLRELEEYDWDAKMLDYGVVSEEHFLAMKEVGAQSPWDERLTVEVAVSGDISGANAYRFTSTEQYEAWVADGRPALESQNPYSGPRLLSEPTIFIRLAWQSTIRENIDSDFFESAMLTMRSLIPEGGDADDIRLICDFDS